MGIFNLLTSILETDFLGIPVGKLAAAVLIMILAFFLRRYMLSLVRRKTGKTDTPLKTGNMYVRTILRNSVRPLGFCILILGLYISFKILSFGPSFDLWAGRFLLFLLVITALRLLFKASDGVAEVMARFAEKTESKLDDQLVPLLLKVVKVVFASIAIVFFLQALGYPVSGLLAGLGIGGIAMALAAQDTIAGIFASVSIFLDRPFMVGDFIRVGSTTGTVEEIGLRSTRIRTPEKTLVTIPNKLLMNETIDDLSQRPKRRVDITIGVTYDTTPQQMQKLLDDLREYLHSNEDVDSESVLVHFTAFSDSSLDIEIRLFLCTIAFAEWLSMRERINLEIMKIVSANDLSMAFPTRTIYTVGS